QFSGRADPRELSLRLHSTQTKDLAEHRCRSDSRRLASVDGLDRRAKRNGSSWLVAFCDPILLANTSLSGNCLDLSRRLRAGWFRDASNSRSRGFSHWPASRQPYL